MSKGYKCFIGGLAMATDSDRLRDCFRPFGEVLESKVISNRDTGTSCGFGFVTFADEGAMNEAITKLHGKELDGSKMTVEKPQCSGGRSGRISDGGGGRRFSDRDNSGSHLIVIRRGGCYGASGRGASGSFSFS